MAAKYYFVWQFGPRHARMSVWPYPPSELSKTSLCAIDRILAVHELPPHLCEKIEAKNYTFAELEELYPAPSY